MRNIGIDFGTCNLKAAERKKNGNLTYLKLGKVTDKTVIPNVILYEKDDEGIDICIGDAASKKKKPESDKIRNIKMHLQEKEWRRKFSFGTVVSAFQVTEDIMKSLFDEIYNTNKSEEITATITVPVNFSEIQRYMIKKAAENAGFKVESIITEPFASIFYLMNESIEDDEESHNVMIFDFGGGTLDLCLASINKNNGKTKVLTKSTIGTTYGGNDINKMILERVIRLQDKEKVDDNIYNEKDEEVRGLNYYYLMEELNGIKADMFDDDEDIDIEESYSVSAQNSKNSVIEYGNITIKQIYDLFSEDKMDVRINKLLIKLFEECDFTPEEVTDVFMVGGSSSIKYFRDLITEFFEKYNNPNIESIFDMNDEIDRDDRVYQSVSMGAVIYSELNDRDDITIKDKIPFFVYSKDNNGNIATRLDINSGCNSPYAVLSDSMKEDGQISIYQTIYGIEDKEVFLGVIKLNDEIKEWASLYRLSVDNNRKISADFAYLTDTEEEPYIEWAQDLIINYN